MAVKKKNGGVAVKRAPVARKAKAASGNCSSGSKKSAAPKTRAARVFAVPVVNLSELNDLITKRAYELFLERGSENGHADEDWKRAEAEIKQKYRLA